MPFFEIISRALILLLVLLWGDVIFVILKVSVGPSFYYIRFLEGPSSLTLKGF